MCFNYYFVRENNNVPDYYRKVGEGVGGGVVWWEGKRPNIPTGKEKSFNSFIRSLLDENITTSARARI